MKRQSEILLSGGVVEQETRRFDETKKETVLMRKKTDAVDYKYFTEANITPIKLSDEFVNNAINTCPELASSKETRYVSMGLTREEARQILMSIDMVKYFEDCLKYTNQIKSVWNFVTGDIASYLNIRVCKGRYALYSHGVLFLHGRSARFQNTAFALYGCAERAILAYSASVWRC